MSLKVRKYRAIRLRPSSHPSLVGTIIVYTVLGMEETVAAQPVVIKIENRVVKNLALLILSDGRTPSSSKSIFIERGQRTGYGVRPVILCRILSLQVIIKRCPLAKRMDNPLPAAMSVASTGTPAKVYAPPSRT